MSSVWNDKKRLDDIKDNLKKDDVMNTNKEDPKIKEASKMLDKYYKNYKEKQNKAKTQDMSQKSDYEEEYEDEIMEDTPEEIDEKDDDSSLGFSQE